MGINFRKSERYKRIYNFIRNLYYMFFGGCHYDYGYIHRDIQIQRLIQKLNKRKSTIFLYDRKKQDQFIFIGDKNLNSTMRRVVFGDIDEGKTKKYQCDFYTTRILKNNKLEKLHALYWKLNKKISLPFKRMWEQYYTTADLRIDTQKNVFVVFLAGAYFEETFSQPELLKRIDDIGKNTFIHKVLYLVDPVDKFPTVKMWFPYFDMVAGCAYEDQYKHENVVFIDTPCVHKDLGIVEIENDIHIRAQDNGRFEKIQGCYKWLNDNDVKCNFIVQMRDERKIEKYGLRTTSERINYDEMLIEELKANVMLEIVVQNVGAGATLRYKEAIMNNKKLLTDNPTVFKLPYYDERYIKFLDKIEDIDIDWIKDRSPIDYNYSHEFSTDSFCEKIISLYIENLELK